MYSSFKPIKPKMDEALTPENAPAGAAPEAVFFFGILPKFLQNIITGFLKVFQKLLNALFDIFSLKPEVKKPPERISDPQESYSTHASFDHLRRIENVEHELAGMRGGGVNKYFKPKVELRLQNLEVQVGLRQPN